MSAVTTIDWEKNVPLVLLILTHYNAGAVNMLATLKKYNWRFEEHGVGQPWKGFRQKMQLVKQAAEKHHPDQILVVVDVYDAFCVRDVDGFVDAFQRFDADVVIGTETLCHWSGVNCVSLEDSYWDDPDNRYNNQDVSGHRYVNGGFVCGYAKALVQIYDWMLQDPKMKDDQRGIGKYIASVHRGLVQQPWRIELDARQILVVNDGNDSIKPDAVAYSVNSSTNRLQTTFKKNISEPWFVHVPGFLMKPSFREGWRVTNTLLPLTSYDLIGKLVLGNNFVHIRYLDKGATRITNTIIWCVLGFSVLFFLILLLFYLRLRRKYHRFQAQHQYVIRTSLSSK